MAPALEDGIPIHLRRSIDATLSGKRDIFKPAPRKLPTAVSIPLAPADLNPNAIGPASAPSTGAGAVGSLYDDGSGSSSRAGPYASVPTSRSFGLTAPGSTTATYTSRVPSLDTLVDSPPSGPAMLGAARRVGSAWVRQQEREWYRGQLAKREDRMNKEAERLFLTAIGPIAMEQAVWSKLPDKVEAVARRNVMRQEARELHRLRLEEWNPQLIAQSAAAALRSALGAVRGGDPGGDDEAASSCTSSSTSALLQQLQQQGQQGQQGRGQQQQKGSFVAETGPGLSCGGGSGAAAAGGGAGPQRRCASALPHRYMETDLERHRIRKALDKLAAKRASSSTSADAGGDMDSSEYGIEGASVGSTTTAAAAAGGGALPSSVSPRTSEASPRTSPLALLRALRARREARWNRETGVLAARMSQFMEAESPASPRVARAAANYKAAARARAASLRAAISSGAAGSSAAAAAARAALVRPRSGSSSGTPGGAGTRSQRFSTGQLQQPEEEPLPPDKAALASQLVGRYEAACLRRRMHMEAAVGAALRRSCAVDKGPRGGHTLHLIGVTLTSREAGEALAEALTHCDHISALCLERCAVGGEALAAVLHALWTRPLRRLSSINTDFPPPTWPWLQKALGRPTVSGVEAGWWLSLRQLSLTGNGLADQGLSALIEVLVCMPSLQSLDLRQCGLSDLAAPHMERLLGECGALRELDLGYNNLGTRAVGALARGLTKARQLTRLALPWNSVGGGVAQLCWTVLRLGPEHCRLASLDLAGTDLLHADLFALAAILRAWPRTPVRRLNVSHNNLVGVAGQCLLRHANTLMQPDSEPEVVADGSGSYSGDSSVTSSGPSNGAAANVIAGGGGGGGGAAVSTTRTASMTLPPGVAAVDGGGAGGAAVTRPLVPILKMPGGGGGGAAGDFPVKKLTINPNPQISAPPTQLQPMLSQPITPRSDEQSWSFSGRPSPSSFLTLAAPPPMSPRNGAGAGTTTTAAAVIIMGTAAPSASVSSASANGRGSKSGQNRSKEIGRGAAASNSTAPEPMVVETTGCVVQPCLPPGAVLAVRPDGRPLHGWGAGGEGAGLRNDEEDEEAARLRERARERARERERERERERGRRLGEEQQQQQPQSPPQRPSSPQQPSPKQQHPPGFPSQQQPGFKEGATPTGAAGSPAGAALGPAEGALLVGAGGSGGTSSFHLACLDLARELPDRAIAALLLEHEMHARRQGHRSVWHGVKWCGKVHKRDGQEVDPLDPVFLGWTHLLPREGLLELLVLVLPPALCPWLGNPRLACNATQSGG